MLAVLIAMVLVLTRATEGGNMGGQLLLCIYPVVEWGDIICSQDDSTHVYIESIEATRLAPDLYTCVADRSRGAQGLPGCGFTVSPDQFYHQFQHKKCDFFEKCTVNGELPSAIVILGDNNCTGGERNAVIIKWTCVVNAIGPSLNKTQAPTTSLSMKYSVTATSADTHVSGDDGTVTGAIVGSVACAVVASAAVCLVLLSRYGILQRWTVEIKRRCCHRNTGHLDVSSGLPTQQPAVLIIDKHGILSSAPQTALGSNFSGSRKATVHRKLSPSRKDVDDVPPSDMEVEVDMTDDYQRFSGDLLDICEEECPNIDDEQDNFYEEDPKRDPQFQFTAFTVNADSTIPSKDRAATGVSDEHRTGRTDRKQSRRRRYELRWNARYQDTTETETDDRRPPALPPPYVLDPESQAYDIPWLPSPADSSDE